LSESPQHKEIKKLLEAKLKDWFGLSITEYPSSGHELDILGVTSDGLNIYIEVIWTHSQAHFHKDMSMLQQSDADMKLVVGSPKILSDVSMVREFTKVAVSETEKGHCIYPEMLDGEKILSDSTYIDLDLKAILKSLVDKASRRLSQEKPVTKPYFEKRLDEILISLVEDGGDPMAQILVGSVSKGEEYLQVSEENAYLVGYHTPTFLRIRDSTARRDRYEFRSYDSSIHLEIYPDGCFHTYFPIQAEDGLMKLDDIMYMVSSFLFFTTRIMKMRNVSARQRIHLELCKASGREVVLSSVFRSLLERYTFPKNKQRLVFTAEFDPSKGWNHIFFILCNIYREICKDLGLVSLSEKHLKDRMKSIVQSDRDLRTEYSGQRETIPRIDLEEVFQETPVDIERDIKPSADK